MEPPTVLRALRDDLRALELTPARREPLEPETAAELYPLVSDVRDALSRLVEGLKAPD